MGGYHSPTSHFSAGYRRFLTPNLILRTAVVVFPSWSYDFMNGVPIYHSTMDGKYVFRTNMSGYGTKSQVNIGAEKVIRKNRWTHGLGVELFTNYRTENASENYFFFALDSTAGQFSQGNAHPNAIDSLGFYNYGYDIGLGFQVFYSVRYDIGKRWRISATVGPSFNFTWGTVWSEDRVRDTKGKYKTWGYNFPNVPLVSDISVGYRF
jgi:hypothetical protein